MKVEAKISIVYKGHDIKTDEEIEKAMSKIGGRFSGSGFNFSSGERDLAYTLEAATE